MAARKKRRLIPKGRTRIIAATKKRWGAVRKAKAAGKAAAPKKATPAGAKPGVKRIGTKSAKKTQDRRSRRGRRLAGRRRRPAAGRVPDGLRRRRGGSGGCERAGRRERVERGRGGRQPARRAAVRRLDRRGRVQGRGAGSHHRAAGLREDGRVRARRSA